MAEFPPTQNPDVAIVGGGAAGLATAIFAARRSPGQSLVIFDGAKKLGAKILVAGGGRCNVTNSVVTPRDFHGGSRNSIKRVLAALPVDETVAFFAEIGVALHEEEHGKLFPNTNKARTVLEALMGEATQRGVHIAEDHRVTDVRAVDRGFHIVTSQGTYTAPKVVLATGGKSLPKTGSDGFGYELAQKLGHAMVPTTPALAPLVLDGDFHGGLSGIAQNVELAVSVPGDKVRRVSGAMLWTHFGVSGPAVLDASRHWHRAKIVQRDVRVTANLLPGDDFERAERFFIDEAASNAKQSLHTALANRMPARVADAVLGELHFDRTISLAYLSKSDRRRLIHHLLARPLPVIDSRGYAYAEVTAGGIPLTEIDPATMQSRVCPGLFLVGEILDVDGRIGGFNFQWAWASGRVAANGLATS